MINQLRYTFLLLTITTITFAQKNEFEGVNFDDEIQSMNYFGFELFQEMTQTDRNIIYSPFSLSVIMSMLENGSDGLTSGEITRTIHLNDDRDERNDQYLAMFKYLAEDTLENGKFEWANILYLARNMERNEDFAEVMNEYYYSEMEKLDFTSEQVVTDKIQKWMNSTLNHEVNYAMQEAHVARNVDLLLANTIYLDGEWDYAFEEKTVIDTFTTAQFDTLQIPYAKGINYPVHLKLNPNHPNDSLFVFDFRGSLQLELLFPSEKDTLANIIERITSSYYNNFQEQGKLNLDTVYLPILKISEMNHMKRSFREMGMGSSFSPEADFSEIGNGLMLDDILHQGELTTGTKGKKQTDKNISATNSSTKEPYRVINFNRPFVFFIKGERSDIFVFMGVVNKF
jgi:serpin B